jgi:hypothetical protein
MLGVPCLSFLLVHTSEFGSIVEGKEDSAQQSENLMFKTRRDCKPYFQAWLDCVSELVTT